MTKIAATVRALLAVPAVAALVLGAISYGIAWIARYAWVEPEALGTLCRTADAPLWCYARTGLIRITEVGGLGLASIVLAVAGFVARRGWAYGLTMAAMVAGGAGLILYNTTFAALGVLIAILRTSRLGRSNAGQTGAHVGADALGLGTQRTPER